MVETTKSIQIPLHKPNTQELLFFFLSGIIISIPFTIFFSQLTDILCIQLPLLYASICSTAIFTPLIEEFAKIYPLLYRHGETQRSLFTIGLLVGLGFGISEFILYVFFLDAPFYIRIPGLFFHAASASIIAYGISIKKPIPYYFLAVSLHFANNFFAIFGNTWFVGGVTALFLSYYLSWFYHKQTSDVPIQY
ncbi:MAG: PrsW family intramembrane metalloprotease [Candidatus Thermoplasmatota archaeon]|nr:PrsW family intramembrane metalloprotease [Candidatus Thermoplasmatota archaeon]